MRLRVCSWPSTGGITLRAQVAGRGVRDMAQRQVRGPQDLPFVGTSEPVDVINHCAWGSVCNAGAGLGKFVPDAYGVARWAIYVQPDSPIRRPEDLAEVPIAVGLRAGRHFNVPYRLYVQNTLGRAVGRRSLGPGCVR